MMEMDSCGALIKQIYDTLEKNANNSMRAQDMTMAQFGVLLMLNQTENRELSLKELEQRLHVAQSTAAGLVSRLEQKGMVEGFADPADRRSKRVRMAEAGIACCEEANQNMKLTEEKLLSGLTETERVIFHSLLQKVQKTMQ